MTAQRREQIAELRRENYSYQFIADALGLSMNTVKSICRRQGFAADGPRKTKVEKQETKLCKHCCRVLDTNSRKGREFCSDRCRTEWWRENRKIVEK